MIMDMKTYYANLRAAAQEKAARNAARARENEIFRANDNRLADIERELAFAEIDGDAKKIAALEGEKRTKTAQNDELLKAMGLTAKDLSPAYECEKCGDTGFIGTKPCSCYRRALEKSAADDIGIGAKNLPVLEECDAADKGILSEYKKMRLFIEKFPSVKTKNVNFIGGTGTGKTLLAGDAAARIAARGFGVLFLSSFELNNVFLAYHDLFSDSRAVAMNALIHADFLVIDDLGAEQNFKNVTSPYLLNLLSERNMRGRSTLITANLTADEFLARYGERVFSRIFDKRLCATIHFGGADKRLQK